MSTSQPWPVLPEPDQHTREFWEAATQKRLVVQRCDRCSTYQHPPRAHCWQCGGDALSFEEVSGRARVYATCVNQQKGSTPFQVPYTNVVVELIEQTGLLMVSHHQGQPPSWAVVGADVEVTFQSVAADVTIPQFVSNNGEAP